MELFDGILHFKNNDFEHLKDHFKKISKSQKPHTLFIGCSDSRVVPNLITSALPGELFVIRNIANIVPFYRATDDFVSTTSAIEYALESLNVKNIVVCGHSNCGGCFAMWENNLEKKSPHTYKWLQLASHVKDNVNKYFEGRNIDLAEREWITEQYNVVEQIKHLLSYPYIKELYEKKELNIYGWHYIIETGEVYNYNKEKGIFELIK